jgi:hypothetical protein
MSEFKFSCPHCQQHLACDEQFSGREIQCPGCHHLIRIPSVPGKTVDYKPESGKTWATYVAPGNAGAPENLSVGKKDEPKRGS